MTARRRWAPPLLLQAPPEPIRTRPLRFDAATSPGRFTLRVIDGARRYTAPAALLTIVHQLGEALVPVLMGLAIERAVATGDLGQLVLWLGLLAIDFAVLSFSWRFGSRIAELGMLAVQHRLRAMVAEHLLRPAPAPGVGSAPGVESGAAPTSGAGSGAAPASGAAPGAGPATEAGYAPEVGQTSADRPRGRAADQPGVALSLATSDVNRLSSAVEIGVYPVGEFAAVVFGGAVLLWISWPLGLAVLLGAPLLLWLTDRAGRTLNRRSGEEQEAAAAAAGEAADLMAGYRVIRGIGAEAEAAVRYRRASRTALTRTLHARRAEGVFGGTMDLVTGLFLTGIAVAAGLAALSGALGLGELITVIGLTQVLIAPLQNFATSAGSIWASATASAERLLTLLRDAPTSEASTTSTPTAAAASLMLSTSTPTAAAAVASTAGDVSAVAAEVLESVRPGEIVAVATDGGGAEVFLAALRRHGHPSTLVVPHAAHLFAGSVLENVALPGTDPARVRAALAAAGCEELADILPHGYDSAVGEGGSALSGGQRQRVALARALAQDAPTLVLHDPTTAVDAVTEAALAARLRAHRGTAFRTVVVTRSPAFLAIADRVHHLPSVSGLAASTSPIRPDPSASLHPGPATPPHPDPSALHHPGAAAAGFGDGADEPDGGAR